MWYKSLDENKFLLGLYSQVPKLENVSITKIDIGYDGDRVSLNYKMPYFPDNPPEKWTKLGYNTAIAELYLYDIKELLLKSYGKWYKGNIEITKDDEGMLVVDIIGTVEIHIKAGGGMLRKIEGIMTEDISNGV